MSIYERTYVATSKDGDGNKYINYYPSKDNAVMQTDEKGKSLDVPISTPIFEDYSGEGASIPELADALSALISRAKMSDLLSNSKAALLKLKEQLDGLGPVEVNLYLDTDKWTGDATNGYTYTCEVAGMTEEVTPIYGLGNTNPTSQELSGFFLIDTLRTQKDAVIITASGKPTVDLIVTLKAVVLNGTPVVGNLEEIVSRIATNETNISNITTGYQKNTASVLSTTLQSSWGAGNNTGSNEFGDVAYGNGTYVAVSPFSAYYSTDGLTWAQATGSAIGEAVAYGNGRFVCHYVKDGTGVNYYSTDGKTWTAGTTGPSVTFNGIVYGNGVFVAVGTSGSYIYYSTDGVTWTGATGASNAGAPFYAVTFKNGRFVAVGGSTTGIVYYSTDGKTWTAGSGATALLDGVTYGNGKFVAVGYNGYTCYSVDGITWSAGSGVDSSISLYGISYGNGKFMAIGSTKNYVSENGINWTADSSSTAGMKCITYGNDRFIAPGGSGIIYMRQFTKVTKKIEDVINELYTLLR